MFVGLKALEQQAPGLSPQSVSKVEEFPRKFPTHIGRISVWDSIIIGNRAPGRAVGQFLLQCSHFSESFSRALRLSEM